MWIEHFKDLCGACGGNKMAIDYSGNVHPCVFSKFTRLGHVSQSLNALSNGVRTKKGLFALALINECFFYDQKLTQISE